LLKKIKAQGYYRWLLSYLPVFFIITSALILIFFFAVSGYSQKQALRANEVFASHVMQAVDSTLKFSEKTIIKEILTNDKLKRFYDTGNPLTPFETFEISRRIKELGAAYQPIQMIYLYRLSDNMVLSPNSMIKLDQFGDQDFVRSVLEQPMSYAWSGSRPYQEFSESGYKMNVVSLVQKVPLNSGSQGLVVVNIRTSAIADMFNELAESDISFVRLMDAQGQPFGDDTGSGQERLSQVVSPYSGWSVQTGLKNMKMFDFFSAFSNIWIAAGLATVLAGAVWLIILIRRLYMPIEAIKLRVQQHAAQKSLLGSRTQSHDEFAFIAAAIEKLVESSDSYEQQYKENLIYRRRWFFSELIANNRPISDAEWQLETKRLGLTFQFDVFVAAVLEMDRYFEFCSTYTQKDQHLLKFAITSVMKEMTQNGSIQVWSEWVRDDRIGVLIFLRDDSGEYDATVQPYCENVRSWIAEHLKLTVTFGVGRPVHLISDVVKSYEDALGALEFKSALGSNNVIDRREIDSLPQRQLDEIMTDISIIAQNYRLGDEQWQQQYHTLFTCIKSSAIRRNDLVHLIGSMFSMIDKEMSSLPDEMIKAWERGVMVHSKNWLHHIDQLDKLESECYANLLETAGEISLLRNNRVNYKVVRQVKEYIEAHHASPDLSLNHLSDEFRINTKTLSRIFKEEIGENFVDYLTKIRLDRARTILTESPSMSVQDIARSVGYIHAITFIRSFKKLTGMTPSDYRKAQ